METLKHEDLVYQVHDRILEKPIRWHSVPELCMHFYGDHNPTLDRQLREVCREVAMSPVFHKIIISGNKGYKAAETREEFKSYRSGLRNTYRSLQDRLRAIDYKSLHDDNMKLPLGEYDTNVYEAFVKETQTGQMHLEM